MVRASYCAASMSALEHEVSQALPPAVHTFGPVHSCKPRHESAPSLARPDHFVKSPAPLEPLRDIKPLRSKPCPSLEDTDSLSSNLKGAVVDTDSKEEISCIR